MDFDFAGRLVEAFPSFPVFFLSVCVEFLVLLCLGLEGLSKEVVGWLDGKVFGGNALQIVLDAFASLLQNLFQVVEACPLFVSCIHKIRGKQHTEGDLPMMFFVLRIGGDGLGVPLEKDVLGRVREFE